MEAMLDGMGNNYLDEDLLDEELLNIGEDIVAVEKESGGVESGTGVTEVEAVAKAVLESTVDKGVVDIEFTLGAVGAADKSPSSGKVSQPFQDIKQNYTTGWDLYDRRFQAGVHGLQKVMGCKGRVCVICSNTVGNEGA